MSSPSPRSTVWALLGSFRRATGGNLTVMFAFASIPVIFALGATADYGFAVKTRARMNAAADAAALAAVTPQMMAQPIAVADATATQMFLSQVAGLPRLTFDPLNLKVNDYGGDLVVNNQRTRKITVSYKAQSQTAFSGILHMPQIAIAGSSTSSANAAANIDYYLMLDTSPSMAIPATQAGINWMLANTPHQGGCAFACHESNPGADNLGNPGGIDNYSLAKNAAQYGAPANLTLRMDLVTQAVANLVTTAQSTSASTGAVYQLAGYTFDVAVANPIPLQLPTSSTQTQAGNIQMLEVASENANNGDQNTNFDAAFTKLNTDMSNANGGAGAGTGTNLPGDHPEQVLMIVTDGVADENYSGNRIYTPLGGTTNLSALTTDWCTNIKAKANVRIAVLYLVYNPLDNGAQGSWYDQKISGEQPEISPVLQNCASQGLFYAVNTGGDVSAAMSSLFTAAAKSGAHLTN